MGTYKYGLRSSGGLRALSSVHYFTSPGCRVFARWVYGCCFLDFQTEHKYINLSEHNLVSEKRHREQELELELPTPMLFSAIGRIQLRPTLHPSYSDCISVSDKFKGYTALNRISNLWQHKKFIGTCFRYSAARLVVCDYSSQLLSRTGSFLEQ